MFITERGKPALVLMTVEKYEEIAGGRASLGELLHYPGAAEIEFEAPRMGGEMVRPAEFD